MSDKPVSLEVYILDKTYRIACNEGEQGDLLASARLLNDQMRQVRGAGKVIGQDRVAIMAGLNLAHELMGCRRNGNSGSPEFAQRLQSLSDKIEHALNNSAENGV